MTDKNMHDYKRLTKDLTKDDLNKEELECYNQLMIGIDKSSENEKDEIAHLIDVVIESDEKVHTNCVRCGGEFEDDTEYLSIGEKRIYCDGCLKKMWGPIN